MIFKFDLARLVMRSSGIQSKRSLKVWLFSKLGKLGLRLFFFRFFNNDS